ncbi:aldehyde dehydrogenase [Trametes versicolor FP-101664 SS1]|uniref:Aldehyde dehydrogenase n=1 Tax=Trametes versicolor (strain FP-101664) TaxID=717944 RepID=R7S7L8_TRAVS|nr:aldehyde dehydrogenase [Trametes versicolor FP-101664 SS1]EIW51640.1 aldehyde dehydrogenase [Trametes versicolor FP-101664 SS1]
MSQTNSDHTYNTPAEIDEIHARLTRTFYSGVTRPLAYRRKQLLQLARMLQDNHVAFEDALLADIGKPRLESSLSEVVHCLTNALTAADSLETWAAPKPCPTTAAWRADWGATLHKEPKGVALIISPWNYPLVLTLNPLIGAIAAGCPTVLKPSELVPVFSQLLATLLPRYLDPTAYAVVKGSVPETTHVLGLRWAHILYTGSSRVGRVVAAAAAAHLTPVTLELGGKSPAVIADDADLTLAARRILHGKIQNAGQLCVSPDYAVVSRGRVGAFVEALKSAHAEFWPEGDHPLTGNAPLSNIINASHHARLVDMLKRTKGKIAFGGETHGQKGITPTVLTDVPEDDVLMEEEIFGPILPIIAVDAVDHAIRVINSKPTPLVIYLFTDKEEIKQKFLQRTQSGQLVQNDVVMQLAVNEMPFGGQGESGCKYTASFDTFTHLRGYINISSAQEPFLQGRYRPYTDDKYQFACAPGKVKIPDA